MWCACVAGDPEHDDGIDDGNNGIAHLASLSSPSQ